MFLLSEIDVSHKLQVVEAEMTKWIRSTPYPVFAQSDIREIADKIRRAICEAVTQAAPNAISEHNPTPQTISDALITAATEAAAQAMFETSTHKGEGV